MTPRRGTGLMIRTLASVVTWLVLGVGSADADAGRLTWEHEGHGSFRKAASDAKSRGRRLLVGLSGGAT